MSQGTRWIGLAIFIVVWLGAGGLGAIATTPEIDELGVAIDFGKENVVLSPDSHSSERFKHGIKVLMAGQYVDNLSEEVKKGMLEKAEQGIWPNKAPMGYLNVEGPNGKKVVIPILKLDRFSTGCLSATQRETCRWRKSANWRSFSSSRASSTKVSTSRWFHFDEEVLDW